MKIRISVLFSLLLMIGVHGCATVRVPIRITHPAEINMTRYKQIAIADIRGNLGSSFSDAIKNRLVESNRFQIVERTRLNQVLRELNLSQSDLADPAKRVKLGKLLSASAMIAGHTEGKYGEEVSSSKATCGTGDNKRPCTIYTRTGVVRTSGSIDVIDIQTGQIIKSKMLPNECSASTRERDKTPSGIDRDRLFGTCLARNVDIFMKAISSWQETVMVPFQKDSNIPALERGINQAKMGEMEAAIKVFASTAEAAETNPNIKPKNIANAYWNLGLAYEYTHQYDKAIATFKKAFSFKPEDKYVREKNRAEMLKTERRKLLEQEGGL